MLTAVWVKSTLAATAIAVAGCSPVEDPSLHPAFNPQTAKPIPDKPLTEANPQRNLYWGDLHIHTSFSTDAFTMGVRSTPEDAYTFVKGGEIEHGAGYGISIDRPLDFAAVTDHAEYLGVVKAMDPDLPLKTRGLRERLLEDNRSEISWLIIDTLTSIDLRAAQTPGWQDTSRSAWQDIITTAERHNDPGRFTAFIGYEWTSMPDERNLHRNVIYRGNEVPELPYS
jgi:hypothetical protein